MDENQRKFVAFLQNWYSKNWRGSRDEFAKFIGLSYSHVSNMLNANAKKGGHEKTRIKICNKIGIDYRTLLDINIPNETKNQLNEEKATFYAVKNGQAQNIIHPKYEACRNALDAIFNNENEETINVVYQNLMFFKKTVGHGHKLMDQENSETPKYVSNNRPF